MKRHPSPFRIVVTGFFIFFIFIVLVGLLRPVYLRNYFSSGERTPEHVPLDIEDISIEDVAMPAGSSMKSMMVGGENRTYTVYVPETLDSSNSPVDVLFVLHGTGGSGEGIRDVGFDTYADNSGFITVYPDSLVRDGVPKWDPTNRQVKDIDFIQAIITDMNTFSGGRVGNIYIAGMSNGSVMTQVMGCVTPEVDGIAAVSAGIGSEFFPYCDANRALPYIGFYGTEDRFGEIAKYEASVAFFANENGCAGTYTATLLPDIAPNDGTTVEKRVYKTADGVACATPVTYYRITGGGHFWPGAEKYTEERLERNTGSVTQDIDATKLIVEFFGL